MAPSTRCWPWLVATGGTARACATPENFFTFHVRVPAVIALSASELPSLPSFSSGWHAQIKNPPALPLVKMHCAPCNRWLLAGLQNSSHLREKLALRCINVDYPQPRGNKKLLLCIAHHDNTPQKPSWTPRRPKCGNHHCCELMPSRLEKY